VATVSALAIVYGGAPDQGSIQQAQDMHAKFTIPWEVSLKTVFMPLTALLLRPTL